MLFTEKELQKSEKPLYYYPNSVISYSALNSFENCPVDFYFHYYNGIKWPSKYSMKMGESVQNAINLSSEGKDHKKALENLEKKDSETADFLIKKLKPVEGLISCDKEYIADFGVGIPIMFIPDILTNTAVLENKYTSGFYTASTVKKHKQGTIYYYGVDKLFGFKPKVFYQIFNYKKKTIELVEVKKTEEDVNEMLSWMKNTLANIKKSYDTGIWSGHHGKFECNLGKACPIKYKIW